MTHWLLQNNIYSEEGWEMLVKALDRFGFSYSTHKCVPFAGTLEPEPTPPFGPVIAMGSYTMSRHVANHGWFPGAWLDNLDFKTQHKQWGDWMLNHDALVCAFGSVPEQPQPFFIRPSHDTKSFTGYVTDWVDYSAWRDGIVRMGPEPDFNLETEVMVCSKKEIYSETRTWIVDGELITCSGYKFGTIKRQTTPAQVDEHIKRFAQEVADYWCPNDAFVLDVADTPEGLKIVEVNNLNSAGFYKADMQRLVVELDELARRKY